MSAPTRRSKPRIDPVIFETLIDRLDYPLERGDVRLLLMTLCEEMDVRMSDGDGLLRKYRRRTLPEVIEAVVRGLTR